MVEISREERDVYLIPQNFVDTGTILGGTVKLRNAVEAVVLAVGSAVPLFYLPLAFNIRLMIVIAVSVPLGVFGVVGIGGDSLMQYLSHIVRFGLNRRKLHYRRIGYKYGSAKETHKKQKKKKQNK